MIQQMFASTLRSLGVSSLKVSARERMLLIVLIAGAAVFAGISAFDWSEGVRISAADARAERQAYEQRLARQAPGLTEQVLLREAEKARRMSFSASTIPIARAGGQAALERLANQAGVGAVRVIPEGEVGGEGAVKTQVYVLHGSFDWPPFLALIEAFSDAPQSIGVLGVSVDGGPAPSFQIKVRVPLVVDRAS